MADYIHTHAAVSQTVGAASAAGEAKTGGTGAPRSTDLAVGTTHIYWDYRRPALQALQSALAASALLRLANRDDDENGGKMMSVLLCGDFNSQPNSAAYRLLASGGLGAKEAETMLRPPPQVMRASIM